MFQNKDSDGYTTAISSHVVYVVAAILTLTAFYACWCRAPLIWDGAYQFDWTLEKQFPYVYLTRFHTLLLWWPTVWASHFTSNTMVLQSIYGLPFLLAPVAAILISWWVVKEHSPHLILWVIFGVAIATLPGQIFVINDSIFQQHLFWPVFMGLFVPLTWPKRIVLAMLAVFQFVHPLGVPLLFGGALSAGLVATVDPSRRRSLLIGAAIMLALSLLAVAKIDVTYHLPQWRDTYAEQEATWTNAKQRWDVAVRGSTLDGLWWMWAAGALVAAQAAFQPKRRRLAAALGVIALLCVLRGGRIWQYWASGPAHYWVYTMDFRRWIGPLTTPFFFLATLEAFLSARRRNKVAASSMNREISVPVHTRGIMAIMLAAVFAWVLGAQCTTWHRLTNRLLAEVRDYPSVVVPLLDRQFEWAWHTPFMHWATGNFVAVMQGKQPAKVFLDPPTERLFRGEPLPQERGSNDPPTGRLEPRNPYYPFAPNSPPGPQGWFDFRPLLTQLAKEPPPTRPRREENMP